MFDRRYPHTRVALPNPVFEYEVYRMHPPRLKAELHAFHTRAVIISHAIAWGMALAALLLGGSQVAGWLIVALCVAILGISAASDVATIAATLSHADDWDVLRLTSVKPEALFQAKIAAAQIRAWRLLSIDVVLRFVAVELAVFLAITATPVFRTPGRGLVFTLPPVEVLSAPFSMVIIALTLFFEPHWRQRALVMVASRIAITEEVHHLRFLSALLVALALLMMRVLAFGVMLLAVLYPMLPLFRLRSGTAFVALTEDFRLIAVIMKWIAPMLVVSGLSLSLYASTSAIAILSRRHLFARLSDRHEYP